MGAYYNDPSGLGVWYVPTGQTPAQAFDQIISDTGQTVSPLLDYSVRNTPAAREPISTSPVPVVKKSLPVGTIPARIHTNIVATGTSDFPSCPSGYVEDDFGNCIPQTYDDSPRTPVPPYTVTANPQQVNVTVNNAVNFSQASLDHLADTVASGIAGAVDQAKLAAADAAQAIQSGIQQSIDAVSNATQSLVGGLKDGLEYIGKLIYDNIGKLASFIYNNIGDLVSKVKDVLDNVIVPLAKTVNSVIKSVNDVISNTIAPIFNTISTIYKDTQALIKAIHEDISSGITGILNLPNDITAAVTSIEGQLQRVFQQLGLKTKDDVSVFTSADGRDTIWSRLDHIGSGVASIGGPNAAKITYSDFVKLSEPDLSKAGAQSINALVGEIGSFVRTLISGTTRSLDAAETGITALPLLLGVEAGTWIGLWELIRALDRLFEPFYKFAEEDLAAKAGLSKLPVGQVLEAYKRGIVNDKDLAEDLAVNGWDEGRIAVLKDLQEYLVDIGSSIDMWHRGIVKDDELANSLRKHGVSGNQMDALKQQSFRLFDPQLATLALRWQLITEAEFDTVMQRNRFTDEEITVRKVTMFTKESTQDAINRGRFEALYEGLGFSDPLFSAIPQDVVDAAGRDGLDSTSAKDVWQRSFFVPPLQEWVELYFRGFRTLRELHAAMDYYRVPAELRDDFIRARQSLIPFRTIPTMLASGIIDEAYAKQQLAGHGFDLVAIEALLKYAQVGHRKSKVAASGDVFGLSVATAKGYFDSGTITPEQYKEVLLAHGYDEASATFTVGVETAHADMLARKQLASNLIAEVKSGIMTVDQAQNMMDAHQFSMVEKSRVLNNISRVKRSSAKVPAEAELHKMAENNVISVDQYRAGMVANGWNEPWLTAFITWRFPNASIVASAG